MGKDWDKSHRIRIGRRDKIVVEAIKAWIGKQSQWSGDRKSRRTENRSDRVGGLRIEVIETWGIGWLGNYRDIENELNKYWVKLTLALTGKAYTNLVAKKFETGPLCNICCTSMHYMCRACFKPMCRRFVPNQPAFIPENALGSASEITCNFLSGYILRVPGQPQKVITGLTVPMNFAEHERWTT